LGQWFKLTFAARIVGGSLKTIQKADSESIKADWFTLDQIKDEEFLRTSIRSKDLLKSIESALNYYNFHGISSFSSYSSIDKISCIKLNMPILKPHNDLRISLLILNENATHCISVVKNDQNGLFLPSIFLSPDIYALKGKHLFRYLLESVLKPYCFSVKTLNENDIDLRYSHVLNVERDVKSGHDGMHILAVINISNSVSSVSLETTENVKWLPFDTHDDAKIYDTFLGYLKQEYQLPKLHIAD
jgi:hypothetical protein